MCNLSKGILEEGREEGRKELLLDIIKHNLDKGLDDKTIIKFLDISKSKYLELKSHIN